MAAGIKYRLFVHSRQQELAIIFGGYYPANVVDGGLTVKQRWPNVLCLLGYDGLFANESFYHSPSSATLICPNYAQKRFSRTRVYLKNIVMPYFNWILISNHQTQHIKNGHITITLRDLMWHSS